MPLGDSALCVHALFVYTIDVNSKMASSLGSLMCGLGSSPVRGVMHKVAVNVCTCIFV